LKVTFARISKTSYVSTHLRAQKKENNQRFKNKTTDKKKEKRRATLQIPLKVKLYAVPNKL